MFSRSGSKTHFTKASNTKKKLIKIIQMCFLSKSYCRLVLKIFQFIYKLRKYKRRLKNHPHKLTEPPQTIRKRILTLASWYHEHSLLLFVFIMQQDSPHYIVNGSLNHVLKIRSVRNVIFSDKLVFSPNILLFMSRFDCF